MEELPELLGRLEQLRFVEWDTHGAWLVVLGSESRGQHPADIDEVIGNDSETHPAMHARVTFIETTAKSVASFEHADAPFATDAGVPLFGPTPEGIVGRFPYLRPNHPTSGWRVSRQRCTDFTLRNSPTTRILSHVKYFRVAGQRR